MKNNFKKLSKENRKTIILTIILAVLLMVLIVVAIVKESGSLVNKVKEDNEIKETSNQTLKDFYEYLNSEELTVIYYASKTCINCTYQTPILETIASDYDIDYLYIDASSISSDARKEITEKLDIKDATPTTVVVKDGEVISTNVGYVDGDTLVSFFIDAGILDKDATYSGDNNNNSSESSTDSNTNNNTSTTNTSTSTSTNSEADEYKSLTFISYSEYQNLIESKKVFVVTIGQTTCSHCIATKPVINKVAEDYNIKFYYLNLTDMSSSDRTGFFQSLTDLNYTDETFLSQGSIGTPLTLVIKNNKIQDYISGEAAYAKYVKLLNKYDIIKEIK